MTRQSIGDNVPMHIFCLLMLRKQRSDGQWWQLFDSKTSHFYYYNVALQQSSWLPPCHDSEILPLAILQVRMNA